VYGGTSVLAVRRLYVAAVVVYATVAVLAVWLGPSLRFAASWLPRAIFGGSIGVPSTAPWREYEAARLFESKDDLPIGRTELLGGRWHRAQTRRPTSVLGEVSGELRGNPREALTEYRRASRMDPARPNRYLRTAKLLLDSGSAFAAGTGLDEGTTALERARRLQVPVADATVRDVFNQKAPDGYEDLASGWSCWTTAAAQHIGSRVD
jgi:hypothetical protein